MPSHGGNTTRRARFLWIRRKYRRQEQKNWQRWKWAVKSLTTPKRPRIQRKWYPNVGPLVEQHCIIALSYGATPINPPFFVAPVTVTPAGRASPPHVSFRPGWTEGQEISGYHSRQPFFEYHCRPVGSWKKRPRNRFFTAFNLTVSRYNLAYFFNGGYFEDDDVLGRHPNLTDFADGDPPADSLWPVPLGYS